MRTHRVWRNAGATVEAAPKDVVQTFTPRLKPPPSRHNNVTAVADACPKGQLGVDGDATRVTGVQVRLRSHSAYRGVGERTVSGWEEGGRGVGGGESTGKRTDGDLPTW